MKHMKGDFSLIAWVSSPRWIRGWAEAIFLFRKVWSKGRNILTESDNVAY